MPGIENDHSSSLKMQTDGSASNTNTGGLPYPTASNAVGTIPVPLPVTGYNSNHVSFEYIYLIYIANYCNKT